MVHRGSTDLEGILAIDKPAGMTSHDVVIAIRRAAGERRIGHAGTLDPAATGLLVLLIGPYTRLVPYLSRGRKRYSARIAFGEATDTDDADGEVIERCPVPSVVLDEAQARNVIVSFAGRRMQVPPAYSAVKRGGVTAHRAARKGSPLALDPRPIEIFEARLVGIRHEPPAWDVELEVSAGTYIRALARDLGRSLGTCAHLASLRRTGSGALTLDDAHPLDECVDAAKRGLLASLFVDPFAALALPVVDADARAVSHGRPLTADVEADLVAVRAAGRLAAIYCRKGSLFVPAAVLPGGAGS